MALAFLAVRTLGNAGMWAILRRRASVLRLGIADARPRIMRELLRPSLASMGFPLGLAFTLQGFVLLIGSWSARRRGAVQRGIARSRACRSRSRRA